MGVRARVCVCLCERVCVCVSVFVCFCVVVLVLGCRLAYRSMPSREIVISAMGMSARPGSLAIRGGNLHCVVLRRCARVVRIVIFVAVGCVSCVVCWWCCVVTITCHSGSN